MPAIRNGPGPDTAARFKALIVRPGYAERQGANVSKGGFFDKPFAVMIDYQSNNAVGGGRG